MASFIWTDILTDLERISDHASNVAACVLDQSEHTLNTHEILRERRRMEILITCSSGMRINIKSESD